VAVVVVVVVSSCRRLRRLPAASATAAAKIGTYSAPQLPPPAAWCFGIFFMDVVAHARIGKQHTVSRKQIPKHICIIVLVLIFGLRL